MWRINSIKGEKMSVTNQGCCQTETTTIIENIRYPSISYLFISWPYEELYANPVSPIAASIIDIDNSNIQMEGTLTREDALSSPI